MRHGKKFNHLSRTSAHRKAMLANMACSLIEHKRIKTTLAKAKALRVYVEPLITKSKNDTTHSRRIVFSYLKQKDAITELFSDIATKVANRAGGYIRILKLSNRLGDNAQMAYIEFVDYNEDYTTDKPTRKKARRARKKITEAVTTSVEEAVIIEETVKGVDSDVIEEAKIEETVKADDSKVIEEVKLEETVKSVESEVIEEVKAKETLVEKEVEEEKKEDQNTSNFGQKMENMVFKCKFIVPEASEVIVDKRDRNAHKTFV
jgi:large subunit ribosomal protein L17